MEPVILSGARKHGVADEDMLHAWRNPIRIIDRADEMTIFIGPARDGALLEVGTLSATDVAGALIVHAMPDRAKYLPHKR